MEYCSEITFFLNGKKTVLNQHQIQPETTLLQYLRNIAHLTGSKLGCGEGGCGACTVMVSHWDGSTVRHRAVNGCLFPLCAVDGLSVITVEGLGNSVSGLDPVQERIAKSNGSQCGFCTPGIVMALYAYLRSNPNATEKDIEQNFDGNLCRCTGYRPILDAAKTFAKKSDYKLEQNMPTFSEARSLIEFNTPVPSNTSICPSTGLPCDCKSNNSSTKIAPNCMDSGLLTSDIIFPPFLKRYDPKPLKLEGKNVTWYRPLSLHHLLTLKNEYNNAKIVVGNTEVGIETKFKNLKYPVLIHPTSVPELTTYQELDTGIVIGGAVTLADLSSYLKSSIATLPESKTRILAAMVRQLKWFASNQIRNVSSIAGNICTASPISDLNPIFIAAKAELKLVSVEGERKVAIRDFFLRYRVVNIQPNEVLQSIFVPFTSENEYFHEYKQARRRDDDIAIVTCAFGIKLTPQPDHPDQFTISQLGCGYGGMSVKTVYCPQTEAKLQGCVWDQSLLPLAYESLAIDLPLADNAPGGMIQFRRSLTTSFFYKFFLYVCSQLEANSSSSSSSSSGSGGSGSGSISDDNNNNNSNSNHHEGDQKKVSKIPLIEQSAISEYHREVSHGSQSFQAPNDQLYPVTYPINHTSAEKQVSGEALYTVDIPDPVGCLHAAYVLSNKAHAKIESIDASKALEMEGVVAFFCASDVPHNTYAIAGVADEELFASEVVTCMFKPVGLIVAETHEIATAASKLVVVSYSELPVVVTIEQAIASQSFFEPSLNIICGDLDTQFAKSTHVIEGTMKTGAQDHFYLETQNALAIPSEDILTIYSSTQNPTKNQLLAAHVLGIAANQVTVICKRMGGGFGGKETRACVYSAVCAFAAFKLQRPVRFVLERDIDMVLSGLRHPFLGKYKCGVTDQGEILALEMNLYSNGGDSKDLSVAVMERAILHGIDNCYKANAIHAYGTICKTNTASNTAFRGFGSPQGNMMIEACIDHISKTLKIPDFDIRERNFVHENDVTYYGQVIEHCPLQKMWTSLVSSSDYHNRLQSVNEFNKQNRWKKRGIAIIPTKFAIAFTFTAMNQGAAMVHVYIDGSVYITHGGTEMGQGLHTKMVQIASSVLRVPISKIRVGDTDTSKVANTSPTAASASTDINGMAVFKACTMIMDRLKPYFEAHPDKQWKDIVNTAYLDRVSLSASAHYSVPDLSGYQFFGDKKGGKRVCDYHTWGIACSEVEIDVLTGNFEILRTDILMEIGKSINPAIDIGQIEGGFIQGLGWCTMEEIVWFDNGYQFTRGPGAYKIPSFNDVPIDFRVAIVQESECPRPTVYSSKGVGEPPFFLASSVFFAIKNACYSARVDAGLGDDYFCLECPATAERIRLACSDSFTAQFEKSQ